VAAYAQPEIVAARHILVVEDDAATREVLRFNLVSEGYEVTEAVDGIEALEKARRLRPDLIVLDHMLPELSGLDAFCARRRTSRC
jgi:CheY-like chemotaxis protein